MKFAIRVLAVAVTVFLISQIFPNLLRVDDFKVAIIAALVLAIINAFVRPIVMFLALPFRILSLGILTLIINGALLLLASELVPGLHVPGLLAAAVDSVIISVVSTFFSSKVFEKES